MRGRLSALAAALLLTVAATVAPAAAQLTESDVFVAEGILALEDRKYDEALQHFKQALDREPDHVEALYYSGVALMAQDKAGPAAEILERARQKSPDDTSIGFQLGLAYFALGQYDRAQPLLERIFDRDPTLNSLGYYVGYMRYRKGDNQGALRAFRAGRTTDANIAQLTRFYSGLALSALGLPAQAAAEVEQALRLQPASPLTGPAERLRQSFAQSREAERRFRADVRTGVYYDDNVTTRPARQDTDTIRSLRHQRHDTTGELVGLRLEYDWLKQGGWTSTIGYTAFATHNNSTPNFNIEDQTASVGVTHQGLLGTMPLITGLQYSFEYLMLHEDDLLERNSVSVFASLIESSRHLTTGIVKVDYKEYAEVRPLDSEEFQDGKNYLVGLLHLIRFAEDRHFIKLGYQFDVEDALGDNLAYFGHRFLAGVQYTLPWQNVRLSYDFGLHRRGYRHKHTLFPEDDPETRARQDDEYSHVLRVEVPLPHRFTVSADWAGTILRSNLTPFTYRRNLYTLGLSWSY